MTTILQHKDIINKLQLLGFREYESKVFLVLLNGKQLSASEIAKNANIPRSAVYDVLNSFVEKGYCNEIETNTITKFQVIDPRVVADKIEKDMILESENKISLLKDTFDELEPVFKSDSSSEDRNVNIELIRGFNKHRQTKFIELFKQAKEEILFMIRLEGYVSEEIDEQAAKFFKNGGVIKSIYEASLNFKIVRNNTRTDGKIEDLIKLCEKFESSGEEVKISTIELPNITIFDREIVFINITDKDIPRHNKSDLIIKNKDFAHKMIDLFNYYWQQSFKVKELKKIYKNNLKV